MTLLTSHLRRRGAKATAVVVAMALGAAATTAPLPAGADQLANDRAEASALAAKISVLGQREDALSEQYDAEYAALAVANARVGAASRALAQARSDQAKTISLLQQDAVEAYIGGGPQAAASASLPSGNLDDALVRQELAQTVASQETDDLDGYRLSADNITTAKQHLVSARNADAHQLARLEKDRDQVEAAQDQLEALESQVTGRIATLVAQIERARELAEQRAEAAQLAQERAQAAAEAQAAAQAQAAAEARAATEQEVQAAAATTTTTVPPSQSAAYVPPATPAIPGVSPAASIAVAAAESRVGDPYVWGAAGPDEFDCSGLVMWAYAQAGVYLDHYSGAQYDETIHIPMSDLEPGDLVFPADPGQHVAMYVGNGEIVQAPYTGADVQVVPLTSFFVLASRVE